MVDHYGDLVATIAEARHRVRFAAGAAAFWCALLWVVALSVTDEARTRIALAIPVVIATTALLLVTTRVGRAVALVAAALTMLFSLIALLSVGLVYLPPAIALAFAAGGISQRRKPAHQH